MPATMTSEVTSGLRTEFEFELPIGYEDDGGQVHKRGRMRLATGRDEIAPLQDPRVTSNQAYLTVILLSRVITELGSLPQLNPSVVEKMFAVDLAFLQDLYKQINQEGHTHAAVACPSCDHEFTVDLAGGSPGES